jgi:ATP-dependent DNA helicase RecG
MDAHGIFCTFAVSKERVRHSASSSPLRIGSRGIATTPAQIDLWRQAPTEHQNLEFKEAKTGYDNAKLCSYCVAIANKGGGHLVLGVADKPPRGVVGTAACSNPVGAATQVSTRVGFRVDIEEVLHPDGRVVVFHIPPRPRGTAYHLDGRYLMRSGESLVAMSEDRRKESYRLRFSLT